MVEHERYLHHQVAILVFISVQRDEKSVDICAIMLYIAAHDLLRLQCEETHLVKLAR